MITYYQSGIQFILKWNAVHIKVTGINLTPKQKKCKNNNLQKNKGDTEFRDNYRKSLGHLQNYRVE